MAYKLFIDDERLPKTDDWTVVRSSQEAIDCVLKNGFPSHIAFDHDLGGNDTSMNFINWLIDYMLDCELHFKPSLINYDDHYTTSQIYSQQCMTVAYEAYGKYYSVQAAHGMESVLDYHQWLEVEGCGWKSLVEKQQNMLTTLIYESNIFEMN